jgi:hypothetical protein
MTKTQMILFAAATAAAIFLLDHLVGDLAARVHATVNTPLEAQP